MSARALRQIVSCLSREMFFGFASKILPIDFHVELCIVDVRTKKRKLPLFGLRPFVHFVIKNILITLIILQLQYLWYDDSDLYLLLHLTF